MSGNGTLESPWDLVTALSLSEITGPGDTFWLRGGVYNSGSDFINTLMGTINKPITIRPYPGEQAIVDGSLIINGSFVIFRDLEIMYSGWSTRETSYPDISPDLPITKSLTINAPGCKIINCVVHDMAQPAFWQPALASELYGCLFYYNGWSGPDRGHGHGIYTQNNAPVKIIKDCIFHDNFGWGIHAFTNNGNINNFNFDSCTSFCNGSLYAHPPIYRNILLGGYNGPAQNPVITNCMTYGAGGVDLGYSDGVQNAILRNNYFSDGIIKTNADISEETNNYYGTNVGNVVFVVPNEYQPDRANVTIFNQDSLDVIVVDLSSVSGLLAGDVVAVRNVQDYFVDIQELTLDTEKKISINMQSTNRTVSTPVQWAPPPTTFPLFGCFIIEK